MAILIEPTAMMNFSGLAFLPEEPVLATRGEGDKIIRIWRLDERKLLPETVSIPGQPEKKEESAMIGDITDFVISEEIPEKEKGNLRLIVKEKSPPGFELLHTLREFEGIV